MTIDTLKLARGLQQHGLTQEQAEGLAGELRTTVTDDLARKSDIVLLRWMIGANIALTLIVLGKLLGFQ